MIEVGLGHELQRLLLSGDEANVNPLADIFHRLAEDGIIHELEEILLGVGLGHGSECGIFVDVGLEPCRLSESNDAMDFRELHPHSQIHLEISIVEDVLDTIT